MTPEQRSLRSRMAAHVQHSRGRTNTAVARAAFRAKFEREVDPEGRLPPEERQRRADHAFRAYMTALSLKASRARSGPVEPTAYCPECGRGPFTVLATHTTTVHRKGEGV